MMAWAAAQNDPAVSLSQQQNIAHHVLAVLTSGLPVAAYDMDTFILVTAANPAGTAHLLPHWHCHGYYGPGGQHMLRQRM